MKKTSSLIISLIIFFSCKNENTEGKRLYEHHCISCHQEGGKGVGKLIPPISKKYLIENHKNAPCIVKRGLSGKIIVDGVEYNHTMPGNVKLTDIDIVNVLNYIDEKFGNGNPQSFNIDEVKEILKGCK